MLKYKSSFLLWLVQRFSWLWSTQSRFERLSLALKQIFLIFLLCICAEAQAYYFTLARHEWNTWPEYCQARYVNTSVGSNSPYANSVPSDVQKKWAVILRGGFDHIHHYCAGLIYVARARGLSDAKSRKRHFETAISEIDYTFRKILPDFPLYSEMAAYLAQAYFEIDETEKALDILKNATNLKPKQPAAYIAYAEILMKSGKNQEALQILLAGQKKATESAEMHYFLGHVYLRLNQFEEARNHAKRAYALGYPLPGLKRMLQAKNMWK